MSWLWRYFSVEEMSCHCGCGAKDMDTSFMVKLELARGRAGFPWPVSSGFRCKEWDAAIGSGNGMHTKGKAVDIIAHGNKAKEIVRLALETGFSGIGLMQHGPHEKRFVHLDTGTNSEKRPRPYIWTYPK